MLIASVTKFGHERQRTLTTMAQITVVSTSSDFVESFDKLSESEKNSLREQFKKLYNREPNDDNELQRLYDTARDSKSKKNGNKFEGFITAFPAGMKFKITGSRTILTKVDNTIIWSRVLETDDPSGASISSNTLINDPKRVKIDDEWRSVTLDCDLFRIAEKHKNKGESVESALKAIAEECGNRTFVVKRSTAYTMLSRKEKLYVGDFPLFNFAD